MFVALTRGSGICCSWWKQIVSTAHPLLRHLVQKELAGHVGPNKTQWFATWTELTQNWHNQGSQSELHDDKDVDHWIICVYFLLRPQQSPKIICGWCALCTTVEDQTKPTWCKRAGEVLKVLSICGMFCFETGSVDISWHQLALLGILDIVLESKASFPRPAAAAHFPRPSRRNP